MFRIAFILLIFKFIFIICNETPSSPFTSQSSHLRMNYSKLDPILFESLSLNILEMLHLKVLANVFRESDEQALMFLLGEIVKRWKRINKHERTVYWYSRQG